MQKYRNYIPMLSIGLWIKQEIISWLGLFPLTNNEHVDMR